MGLHLTAWERFDRVTDNLGARVGSLLGQEEDHFDFIIGRLCHELNACWMTQDVLIP